MSSEKKPDLSTEAAEWAPDASAQVTEELATDVTLVVDPFVLSGPTAADIRTAQEEEFDRELEAEIDNEQQASTASVEQTSDEPASAEQPSEEALPPLELAPEDTDLMNRLSQAMIEMETVNTQEAEAVLAEQARQAEALLAEQIAEDEALAKAQTQQLLEASGAPAAEAEQALEDALPVFTGDATLDVQELMSCIEALVFMSERPLSPKRLQELLGPEQNFDLFQEAATRLRERYRAPSYGVELVMVAGGLQFRTKPGRAALARKLAKVQTQKLSSGAMETLAITAYKQPVMKEEIDKIRGVDSSYFIRILLDRKLIKISGRSELPGRPLLYSTTDEFMEVFGLQDLHALPPLRELEGMVPGSQSEIPGQDSEDPRVRELRKMVHQMNSDRSGRIAYDPKEDEKILQDIRDRVKEIPTTTPFLAEQDAAAKAALLAEREAEAAAAAVAPEVPPVSPEPSPS